MIIANSALRASLAIYHLISNARSWNNFLFHFFFSEQKTRVREREELGTKLQQQWHVTVGGQRVGFWREQLESFVHKCLCSYAP